MNRERCESIRPLISAFMDGELSPDESRQLREHLDSCPACHELFDEYRLVRDHIRQLPPDPEPPEAIADAVWQHAREQRERPRLVRLFSASSTRLGMSAVAAAALLVIASAFFLVRGYQQSLPPSAKSNVPASAAVARDQPWPVTQAVKIMFNKPMDHASVLDNLKILPASEAKRLLPVYWPSDDTLEISNNPANGVLLLPDSDYTITILGTAKDAYGHSLGKPFTISFHTTKSQMASLPTPTGTPTQSEPAATPTESEQTVASPQTTAIATGDAPSGSTATGGNGGPIPTASPTGKATQAPIKAPALTPTPTGTPTNNPTPTPSPTKQAATPTVSPSPTSTPSPTPTPAASPTVGATPSSTPEAEGTPSGTPPSTATPEQTGTATPVPVTGAFGSVYWANQAVQDKLGAPDARGEYTIVSQVLAFQKGTMYDRRGENPTIYVMLNDQTYTAMPDDWKQGDPDPTETAPDPSVYVPKGNFGKVWEEGQLADSIGYAVAETPTGPTSVPAQDFANGSMLYSDDGFVYVIYDDGTWEVYPDTSGHGDLLTPTPEASPSTTPTDGTATPASSDDSQENATPAATPTETSTTE